MSDDVLLEFLLAGHCRLADVAGPTFPFVFRANVREQIAFGVVELWAVVVAALEDFDCGHVKLHVLFDVWFAIETFVAQIAVEFRFVLVDFATMLD